MLEKDRILIVDDEKDLRELLSSAFKFAGLEVETAGNGEEALAKVRSYRPDLIILDIMMPKMSGLGVAQELRSRGDNTPILFLSARDETENKIEGLNAGADDYVTKPFSIEEVGARVKAILKRTKIELEDSNLFQIDELALDNNSHQVTVAGKTVELSPTEYNLLKYLMENEGRVVSKEQILDQVWGYEMFDSGAIVESYISYLRKKISEPGKSSLIQTKRGVGYIIQSQNDV
ncbi:MAG: response regulator transcription factor [Bifidobacteriaceae bacterium]|jgi:two-component system OmpR family response regulator|nr:response regulator transcription factor [Bifidobacteriaceae bacterium]